MGGAESTLLLSARELRQRGHSVHLLYQKRTGKSEDIWQQTFASTFRQPGSGNLEHLEAVIGEVHPDALFIHNFDDLPSLEALLETGVPSVRMVHDHALYCMREYKYNYFTRAICTRPVSGYCVFPCMATVARNRGGKLPIKLASYSRKLKELSLSRRCSQVLVYSDYCRRELMQNGFSGERIHTYAPVESGNDEPASSFSDRNLILFAGQIIRGKGVDVLLKALRKVQSPFECVILGDGSHRAKCEKLSARLGLSQKVHFAGYIPREQMREYYLEASVFAVSSVWPEPFGLVGPEAMRYGLPVVAFDAGGIKEWLLDGENGLLAPWMDTTAYSAAIDRLLRNKSLARTMGQHGRQRVRAEYNLSRQVGVLEQIFLELTTAGEKRINENARLNVVYGDR